MSNFISVKVFFDKLFPHERKVLKRFILLHETNDESRSISLFNLFEKNIGKDVKENDFIIKIYKSNSTNNNEAFRKLLERFRDKMYESHFLDVNMFKKQNATPYFAALMEVKKLIGLSHNVIGSGVSLEEENRLLLKGINIAKKHEFFDELLIFLKFKLHINGFVSGFKKQKKQFDEIEWAENCRTKLFQSKKICYTYVYDLQYKSTDDLTIKEEIKNACEIVKSLYNETKLANLFFDWYQLEIQYCHFCTDFSKAEILQEELIETIIKTPALYQHHKIADGYSNLGYAQAYLFKFESAIDSISKAIKYSPRSINAACFYNEAKSFLLIYSHRYEEAILLLEEIISAGSIANSPIQFSIRIYLLATAKFLIGDYKKSFKLLQETKEIENDKEGWNIGIRMLQIFLTLETEKVDLADQRIESLRKHIERTTKMKSVRKRDVVIFRLLNHLSRSGFDFQEVWEDRQKDFKLLQSDEPDYRWIPRSHELILFEQWFESKVKGVPYSPKFPNPIEEGDQSINKVN